MLSARLLLGSVCLLAALTLACTDDIPFAPLTTPGPGQSEPQQKSVAQPVVDTPRDPDRPLQGTEIGLYTYIHVSIFADRMLQQLHDERVWCDEQEAVAELRGMLDDHEPEEVWRSLLIPAEGEDLRAVQIVAQATAQARGIAMQQLPPVFLVGRTSLRHYACLYEEIWEDLADEDGDWTLGRPASRLVLIMGQDVVVYGEMEQSWLSATLAWGWYGESEGADELDSGKDGVGRVVIVSKPPMPSIFVSVISHELVHFLQDQWTGWRLHDWYRDSATTEASRPSTPCCSIHQSPQSS